MFTPHLGMISLGNPLGIYMMVLVPYEAIVWDVGYMGDESDLRSSCLMFV